jgi:hypothetical protein
MKTINIKGKDVHNLKKHWDTRGRTGSVCKNGYRSFSVGSRKDAVRKYEHRIVWEKNFGIIPDGYQVHHKDGNRLNNNIENLELIKSGEHQRLHAIKNGLGKDRRGVSPTNKTADVVISRIKKMRESGALLIEIMKATGLSYPTIIKYTKEA